MAAAAQCQFREAFTTLQALRDCVEGLKDELKLSPPTSKRSLRREIETMSQHLASHDCKPVADSVLHRIRCKPKVGDDFRLVGGTAGSVLPYDTDTNRLEISLFLSWE